MTHKLKILGLFIMTILLAVSCKEDNDEPEAVKVESISLSETSLSLEEGKTATLTATVLPDDAADKTVSWTSSDAAIATVDENGQVTAVKAGKATITATTTDGNKSATCEITVVAKTIPVESVSLSSTSLELEKGKTETLTATVLPDNATDKTVTWKSDDENIAKVDENGKVTAVKVGKATITATTKDGNKTAKCEITVTIKVESVSLNKTSLELEEGKPATLTATVLPANAADKTVTWTSSDETIAKVDENGKVTAVKEGNISITVTTKDGNKTATCTVNVLSAEAYLLKYGFTDSRDGTHYKAVKIGDQIWMAENLKHLPSVNPSSESSETEAKYYVYFYNGSDKAVAKQEPGYKTYGALYNWPAAKQSCPTGWHLPSDAEWTKLTDHLGGENVAGGKLKEKGTTHWDSPNKGATNESGFTALSGGCRRYDSGSFLDRGEAGLWWSSTESSSAKAYERGMGYDYEGVNRNGRNKSSGYSVRCVRD